MCTGVDACPPQSTPEGGERDARACTWRSLIPNTLERTAGKRYSCTCGMPGDVWSEYYCRLQPHTNFLLNLVTTVRLMACAREARLRRDAGRPFAGPLRMPSMSSPSVWGPAVVRRLWRALARSYSLGLSLS